MRSAFANALLLSLCAVGFAGGARTADDPVRVGRAAPTGSNLVQASLICDATQARPGSTVTLGLHFVIAPGWHLYGRAANDSGFPPEWTLQLPEGLSVSATQWPAPERHTSPGDLLDHVYEHEVTVLLPLNVADDMPLGTVTLSGSANWLVCEEFCLAGDGSLNLTLEIGEAEPKPSAPAVAAAFGRARARMPGLAPSDVSIRVDGHTLEITVPGASALAFLPDPECFPLQDLLSQGSRPGETLQLTRAERGPGGPDLTGVLAVTRGQGSKRITSYHRIQHPGANQAAPTR